MGVSTRPDRQGGVKPYITLGDHGLEMPAGSILVGITQVAPALGVIADARVTSGIQRNGGVPAGVRGAIQGIGIPAAGVLAGVFQISVEGVVVADMGISGVVERQRGIAAHTEACIDGGGIPAGSRVLPGIVQVLAAVGYARVAAGVQAQAVIGVAQEGPGAASALDLPVAAQPAASIVDIRPGGCQEYQAQQQGYYDTQAVQVPDGCFRTTPHRNHPSLFQNRSR